MAYAGFQSIFKVVVHFSPPPLTAIGPALFSSVSQMPQASAVTQSTSGGHPQAGYLPCRGVVSGPPRLQPRLAVPVPSQRFSSELPLPSNTDTCTLCLPSPSLLSLIFFLIFSLSYTPFLYFLFCPTPDREMMCVSITPITLFLLLFYVINKLVRSETHVLSSRFD